MIRLCCKTCLYHITHFPNLLQNASLLHTRQAHHSQAHMKIHHDCYRLLTPTRPFAFPNPIKTSVTFASSSNCSCEETSKWEKSLCRIDHHPLRRSHPHQASPSQKRTRLIVLALNRPASKRSLLRLLWKAGWSSVDVQQQEFAILLHLLSHVLTRKTVLRKTYDCSSRRQSLAAASGAYR